MGDSLSYLDNLLTLVFTQIRQNYGFFVVVGHSLRHHNSNFDKQTYSGG